MTKTAEEAKLVHRLYDNGSMPHLLKMFNARLAEVNEQLLMVATAENFKEIQGRARELVRTIEFFTEPK